MTKKIMFWLLFALCALRFIIIKYKLHTLEDELDNIRKKIDLEYQLLHEKTQKNYE